MGLFDLFLSEEKRIAKSSRKLLNRDAHDHHGSNHRRVHRSCGTNGCILMVQEELMRLLDVYDGLQSDALGR